MSDIRVSQAVFDEQFSVGADDLYFAVEGYGDFFLADVSFVRHFLVSNVKQWEHFSENEKINKPTLSLQSISTGRLITYQGGQPHFWAVALFMSL